jgi:dTDP-4-dehydrorhamnose reductase
MAGNSQMKSEQVVAVIGANGQLGTDIVAILQRTVGVRVIPLTHHDIEVADLESVEHAITGIHPQVVISTAAWHPAESVGDPKPYFAVNAVGGYHLATVCGRMDAELVWFSTDYVFDGQTDRPYSEVAHPNPISTYGVSKYAGELLIRNRWSKYFIIRVAGLYGVAGCRAKGGANVVENFIRLGQRGDSASFNADQYASSTYTLDVAERIPALLGTRSYGIYHMVNTGILSWYQFAKEVFACAGIAAVVLPKAMNSQSSDYPRPRYSVLQNVRLGAMGVPEMPTVRDALRRYLAARGEQSPPARAERGQSAPDSCR